MTTRRAVFLDRDGTLNEDRNIGATPILVLTGYGRAAPPALAARGVRPVHTADGVLGAAVWILEHGRPGGHGPV